jgi:hyperosmotically inducible periplasmic protein
MKSFNVYKQIRSANRILLIPCLAAFLGLAGCPDGSSQQAGQRMNSDAEKAQKKIEKSEKAANKEIEVLKDTVEQKAEQAKENIDRSAETAKETLEKVEEKVEENVGQAKDKVDQIQENTEKKLDVLKESPEKPETTGEYIDDSVITIKVKSAILGSSWLSASHIEVTTVKGIVTLSGTVDSEQNIAKAIDVAKSQEHVMGVQTDLIVSDNTSSKK